MAKYVILFIVLAPAFLFAQVANKTVSDSVFEPGDIIKIPRIRYGGDCVCSLNHQRSWMRDSLKIVGDFIVRHPNIIFQLEAHTDTQGEEQYKLILSQTRANNTRAYLLRYFPIDSSRITAKGFGASSPIYPEQEVRRIKSEDGQEKLDKQNRRTQLKVIALK
ncbi:MAG TPA: OmpA family protein [Bacteroidia bacterium]|nr:OmpA family protein [Bacteroidia bacterium]